MQSISQKVYNMTEFNTSIKASGKIGDTPINLTVSERKHGHARFVYEYWSGLDWEMKIDMTNAERKVWCFCKRYMERGNRLYAHISKIAETLQLSKSVVYLSLNELKKKHLVVGKRGVYLINPLITFNGAYTLFPGVYKLYQEMWKIENITEVETYMSDIHIPEGVENIPLRVENEV